MLSTLAKEKHCLLMKKQRNAAGTTAVIILAHCSEYPLMSHSSIKNLFWPDRTEGASTRKQRGLHPPLKLSCKSLMQSVNRRTMLDAAGVSLSNQG